MIDESVVRDQVWPGELLLWVGRPRRGLHLLPGDWMRIPFMAAWLAFAVLWTVGASADGGAFFSLFGLAFVGIGVGNLVWPWAQAMWRSGHTIYAVTDRRVIARSDRGSGFEMAVAGIPMSVYRQGRSATVAFTSKGGFSGLAEMAGFQSRSSRQGRPNAFIAVEDGDALLAALDRARAAPGPASPTWPVTSGSSSGTSEAQPSTPPPPAPGPAVAAAPEPPTAPTPQPAPAPAPASDAPAQLPGWGSSPGPYAAPSDSS